MKSTPFSEAELKNGTHPQPH